MLLIILHLRFIFDAVHVFFQKNSSPRLGKAVLFKVEFLQKEKCREKEREQNKMCV